MNIMYILYDYINYFQSNFVFIQNKYCKNNTKRLKKCG